MIPIIAIDGPAGSGKGTMARKLASHFSFVHLDSGMLYRAIAYLGITYEELSKLTADRFIKISSHIQFSKLRTDAISEKTSKLATKLEIRKEMNRLLREYTYHSLKTSKGVILDGRDIGTAVFPEAACKLFITADVGTRAMRRFNYIKKTSHDAKFESVLQNIKSRDNQDSSRSEAPLAITNDYILIDTTNETEEQSFQKILNHIGDTFKRYSEQI